MRDINIPEYIKIVKLEGHLGYDINDLIAQQLEAAIKAAQNAYCPYSKFHVGGRAAHSDRERVRRLQCRERNVQRHESRRADRDYKRNHP